MLDILNPLLRWIVLAEIAYWSAVTYSAHKQRKRLKQQMEIAKAFTRQTGEIFTENLRRLAHLNGYTEIESVTVAFGEHRTATLKFGNSAHMMAHVYSGAIDTEEWAALCERWRMTYRPQEEIEE